MIINIVNIIKTLNKVCDRLGLFENLTQTQPEY